MFTKDKQFYRDFFSLYWLLVLQNMVVLAVNLADNVMLGNYGQAAMSGAATVNQIQFVVQNLIVGIGDGVVVLGSQYWGQRRAGPIKELSSIAIRGALCFALLMFALVSLFPHGAIQLFTPEPSYIEEGMRYLSIIRFTYPVFALTSVLLATLRSAKTVRIAFWISLSTLFVNFGINYVLIFGNFGAPRLGVQGAAIGTLTARVIELVIVLIYAAKFDDKLRLRFSDYVARIDRSLLRDFTKVVVPIVAVSGMWGLNTALQTVMLGHLDKAAIAANSAASNLMMLLKVASVGAAASASVVIGNTIGTGDVGKVKEYARTLQGIFLVIGALTGLSLFALRGPVLSMYKGLTDETLRLANQFLLVMCVTATGMAYQMPTITGIIRGGGDTRFCMINDIVSIWLIVLPVSFLAAFVWHWPPVAVVICLNSDQVFKCAAAAIKCNRFTWIKRLTRAAQ